MNQILQRFWRGGSFAIAAAGLLGLMGLGGCGAERQKVTTVEPQYSYAEDGVRLSEPTARPSVGDGLLGASWDRPAASLGETAAVDGFE
ncbi:MAG: hypothetical protein AAF823_04610 [Planctomycetota bacterium]